MAKTTLATKSAIKVATLLNELFDNSMHSSVGAEVNALISELGKAKTAIERKAAELGSVAGLPIGGVENGAGEGYRRQYQHGVIYFLPTSGPCWVTGAILAHYRDLGGDGGSLGYPTTDELTPSDGHGRYSHFERGSIYWTYGTGARAIQGAIRDRWAALGWERSWLGYPRSDVQPFAEEGAICQFENGAIYWWDDTGAIDLRGVSVRYKGLYCFGDTNEIGADKPYAIFGVVPIPPAQPSQLRTGIYDDVDAGDSRPDNMELYRGFPGGIALAVSLLEHDHADPDYYLDLVKQAVKLAGKGVSEACGALLGAEAVPACESVWTAAAPAIVDAVNGLLGTDDDLLGYASWGLSAKEMVTLAGTPRQNFWGIEYHRESSLISDGDASYKVYIDFERM